MERSGIIDELESPAEARERSGRKSARAGERKRYKPKSADRSDEAKARTDAARMEVAAMPPIWELTKPDGRDRWLATLTPPEIEVSAADEEAARDVMMLATETYEAEAERTKDGLPPLEVTPALRPFGHSLIAALGGVARGEKTESWAKASGLTWTRLQMFAKLDKHGFGRLWTAAWKLRDESSARKVREKAVQRALEGDAEPVIGRISRDEDGVVATRIKFSDRMMEYLLEEAKPKSERVAAPLIDASKKTTQVVGQQIVYNLPDLPDWFKGTPVETPPKVIDITPK